MRALARPAVLLVGDDHGRMLRIGARALRCELIVTMTDDPAARIDGYACVVVDLPPGAAREAITERLAVERANVVFVDDASDDETCDRMLVASGGGTRDDDTTACLVLSTFRVANGMSSEVAQAFRDRPRRVEGRPGFRDLQVISPEDDRNEFWLLTNWSDEQAYRDWHHSHLYREAHSGIPRGLRLDPSATRVRLFRSIAR